MLLHQAISRYTSQFQQHGDAINIEKTSIDLERLHMDNDISSFIFLEKLINQFLFGVSADEKNKIKLFQKHIDHIIETTKQLAIIISIYLIVSKNNNTLHQLDKLLPMSDKLHAIFPNLIKDDPIFSATNKTDTNNIKSASAISFSNPIFCFEALLRKKRTLFKSLIEFPLDLKAKFELLLNDGFNIHDALKNMAIELKQLDDILINKCEILHQEGDNVFFLVLKKSETDLYKNILDDVKNWMHNNKKFDKEYLTAAYVGNIHHCHHQQLPEIDQDNNQAFFMCELKRTHAYLTIIAEKIATLPPLELLHDKIMQQSLIVATVNKKSFYGKNSLTVYNAGQVIAPVQEKPSQKNNKCDRK